MSKIAILLPKEEMLPVAKECLETSLIEDYIIKKINTSDSVVEAREAIENGAEIIIARGIQADLIMKNTKMPVVPIALTSIEMSLLVKKAKEISETEKPHIAIIGYKNNYKEMTHLDELFNVSLKIIYITAESEIDDAVISAYEDKCDCVIGGDRAVLKANSLGMKTLFQDSSKESIMEALDVAKKMIYSMRAQKETYSEFEALLDASFNQIYQINNEHLITIINKMSQNYLNMDSNDIIGKSIEGIFYELNPEDIDAVFSGDVDIISSTIHYKNDILNVTIQPIKTDKINALTVSISKLSGSYKIDNETMRKQYLNGYIALHNFNSINTKNNNYKKIIKDMKDMSSLDTPFFIESSVGINANHFAEAMHNYSPRKDGPYIYLNCYSDNANEELFKENKAIDKANHGTLVLNGIERFSLEEQQKLYNIMAKDERHLSYSFDKKVDVKFIIISNLSLSELYRNEQIYPDLYYMLVPFSIRALRLNEIKEDFSDIVNEYLNNIGLIFHKSVTITSDGLTYLKEYDWPGNYVQLYNFLKGIVFKTENKKISIPVIKREIDLYQDLDEKTLISNKKPEQRMLEDAYEKHNGNRAKMAEELEISTTTLWRKLKKYNLI